MKKFEIINEMYIKKISFGKWEEKFVFHAMNIKHVVNFYSTHEPSEYDSPERYLIHLEVSSGISMSFVYLISEINEYYLDMETLKKSLMIN